MSANLILITGLIYIYIAIEQGYLHNNYGLEFDIDLELKAKDHALAKYDSLLNCVS
jgi:hypothetical protein